LGRFITSYRSPGDVAAPHAAPARIETEWQLEHGARLQRHPFTRMAWRRAGRGAQLYASGHDFPMPLRDARRLAASTEIDGAGYAALSQAGRDAVMALYGQGHYQLPADEEE
jgi:50S ribosomal protein L16 3-hydroxylase